MRAIQRFGKQLQQLRTRRGLTQEQLAVTAGLSRTFLTRLELGQHDPSLSTLVRLAKAQLRCEQFREQSEYVRPSDFVDFTQTFEQSAFVHGPDLI
jgi:transcriptional regulator with XRE-family HTH domain